MYFWLAACCSGAAFSAVASQREGRGFDSLLFGFACSPRFLHPHDSCRRPWARHSALHQELPGEVLRTRFEYTVSYVWTWGKTQWSTWTCTDSQQLMRSGKASLNISVHFRAPFPPQWECFPTDKQRSEEGDGGREGGEEQTGGSVFP